MFWSIWAIIYIFYSIRYNLRAQLYIDKASYSADPTNWELSNVKHVPWGALFYSSAASTPEGFSEQVSHLKPL